MIISAREARLLDKDKSLDPDEPQAKLRGSWPGARTRPTRTVRAGDRIGSLEVIAAPGHTPGHVAFLDTRDRTLLCGDAFSTLGGVGDHGAGELARSRCPRWRRGTGRRRSRPRGGSSSSQPARLAPGHGPVVESPAAAMQAAIERASG